MNGQAANPLPAEPSPLLGREHDLDKLTRLLGEGARILTLRGPGGIGKTALALRLAHIVREHYDHVLFIDLSALRDPEGLLPAIVAALPGVEAASQDPGRLSPSSPPGSGCCWSSTISNSSCPPHRLWVSCSSGRARCNWS